EDLGRSRNEGHGPLREKVALTLRLGNDEDPRVWSDHRLPDCEKGRNPVLANLATKYEDGGLVGEHEVRDAGLVVLRLHTDEVPREVQKAVQPRECGGIGSGEGES